MNNVDYEIGLEMYSMTTGGIVHYRNNDIGKRFLVIGRIDGLLLLRRLRHNL